MFPAPFSARQLAHHELFFAVDPLDPLSVDLIALAAKQTVKPPMAEPATLPGERLEPVAQILIIPPPLGRIPDRGPVAPDHAARPPLDWSEQERVFGFDAATCLC